MCLLFETSNEYFRDSCSKADVNSIEQMTCLQCEKTSRNFKCWEAHQNLSKRYCKMFKMCQNCGATSKGSHRCLEYFCKICFNYHNKSDFCRIPVKPIKINTNPVFVVFKFSDYIFCSPIRKIRTIDLHYSFMFNTIQNKCFIVEHDRLTFRILSENNFYGRSLLDVKNFINPAENATFLLDDSMFCYFQKTLDVTHISLLQNEFRGINLNWATILKISQLCPTTNLNLFQFSKETDLTNILFVEIPDCIKEHELSGLSIRCYTKSIVNVKPELYQKVLKSEIELNVLKNMTMFNFMVTHFLYNLILLQNYVGKVTNRAPLLTLFPLSGCQVASPCCFPFI